MDLEVFLVSFVASFLGSSLSVIVTIYFYKKGNLFYKKKFESLKRSLQRQIKKEIGKNNEKT